MRRPQKTLIPSARRATGAEITAFYDAWPMGDDWYYDHYDQSQAIRDDNDEALLVPDQIYDLQEDFGVIAANAPDAVPDSLDFAREFRRWRKAQTSTVLVATVPKDVEAQFRAWCGENSVKIG